MHAFRQLHRGDVHAVADLQAGKIDLEVLRNGVSPAGQLDLVAHDVEHAAALDAGALILVDEVHRHLDVDAGGGGDAQKIDVDRLVAHRIELHVARKHALGLAVHLHVDKGGKETALGQQLHRSEERSVGKACVSTSRSRWSRDHSQ